MSHTTGAPPGSTWQRICCWATRGFAGHLVACVLLGGVQVSTGTLRDRCLGEGDSEASAVFLGSLVLARSSQVPSSQPDLAL